MLGGGRGNSLKRAVNLKLPNACQLKESMAYCLGGDAITESMTLYLRRHSKRRGPIRQSG